jgi:hypothetical protein
MHSAKTKYISSWGITGFIYPIIVVLISQYGDRFGAKIPRFIYVPIVPLVVVTEALGLAVTDGGGDSGALLPTIIIIIIVLLLNAAFYAGVCWLSWLAIKKWREFREKSAPNALDNS